MPPRRRSKTPEVTAVSVSVGRKKPRPRFSMIRGADGSERAERSRTRAEGERDQALADFFGIGPALDVKANIRTMDSLLGELLQELNLQEETLGPEILAEAWHKAVGDMLSGMSELVSLSRQTAVIRVSHAAARYELTRLKPQIVRVLNQTLGSGSVTRVKLIQ